PEVREVQSRRCGLAARANGLGRRTIQRHRDRCPVLYRQDDVAADVEGVLVSGLNDALQDPLTVDDRRHPTVLDGVELNNKTSVRWGVDCVRPEVSRGR